MMSLVHPFARELLAVALALAAVSAYLFATAVQETKTKPPCIDLAYIVLVSLVLLIGSIAVLSALAGGLLAGAPR